MFRLFRRRSIDTEALRPQVEAVFREFRDDVMMIAANMVETASREEPYTGEFGAGYRQAQIELAEMLRRVARGEITSEMCHARLAIPRPDEWPEHEEGPLS